MKDAKLNCEHCDAIFKTKSSLNNHRNKATYCLIIQGKVDPPDVKLEIIFKCPICKKNLSSKQYLETHAKKCESKKVHEFKCNNCGKNMSSKQNLESHQKRCKINNKEKEVYQCQHCDKILSSKQNLIHHLTVCLEKKDKELKELKSQKELADKFIINSKLENYKEQLEKKEQQIKDLQDKLDKIANKAIERPTTVVSNTTTNNNLNIMSSLDFNNLDKIKDAIENRLNVNHVVDGQKGLAKFMVDTILTDEDGNLLYVCTDASRNMFKYKNSDGEINKDVEAKKLIAFMVDAGIQGKSFEIARKWYKNGDENGDVDMTKYGIMVNPQEKIMKIEDESSRFKRELASMTSV